MNTAQFFKTGLTWTSFSGNCKNHKQLRSIKNIPRRRPNIVLSSLLKAVKYVNCIYFSNF